VNWPEFQRSSDRLAYLMAVGKYEGTADIARSIAQQVLDAWGREVCPITGQQFFYVSDVYGGESLEGWVTPHRGR
jgi:hypothetical protein